MHKMKATFIAIDKDENKKKRNVNFDVDNLDQKVTNRIIKAVRDLATDFVPVDFDIKLYWGKHHVADAVFDFDGIAQVAEEMGL